MPAATIQLPQIPRFLAGLNTQRNPIDTPFSIIGMNVVAHHDALIDGFNMEVTSNNTLMRRWGLTRYNTTPLDATEIVDHFWLFKNLKGTIRTLASSNLGLKQFTSGYTNAVKTFPINENPWAIAITGDYLYAANGVNSFRWQPDHPNPSAVTTFDIGIKTPPLPPIIDIISIPEDRYTSTFIPSNDLLQGVIQIIQSDQQLTLNIKITSTKLLIDWFFDGGVIGPGAINTVAGTTSGGNATNTAFDPPNGTAHTYVSVTLSGSPTIAQLVTAITGNIDTTTANAGQPLLTFKEILGNAAMGGELYPTHDGSALYISSQAGLVTITSGISDKTSPDVPLIMNIGQYPATPIMTLPFVDNSDILSGSFTISGRIDHGAFVSPLVYAVPAFPNNNILGLAASIGSRAFVNTIGTQTQLTYVFSLPTSTTTLPTNNNTQTITANTLQNVTQNYALQFDYELFNAFNLRPQRSLSYGFVWKNPITGHVSTMSPAVNITDISFGSLFHIKAQKSNDPQATMDELYRTADGGSSYLLTPQYGIDFGDGYITFADFAPDAQLNEDIVAPIAFANNPPPTGIKGLVKHVNRMWGFVDNKVYYSGGPDTTNGLGDEAWPPANYEQFPGNVVKIVSTSSGLLVFLSDDLHIIEGVDTSSFYPHIFAANFGISNYHATYYDGQTIYIYTTSKQLHALSPSGQDEIGYKIGDQLQKYFDPLLTNLTVHRGNSTDYALFVSNGVDSIFRYSPGDKAWSTRGIYTATGIGAISSIETSPGILQLLAAPNAYNSTPYIFYRDYTSWQDFNTPYAASATIGGLPIAPPGILAPVNNIIAQMYPVGTAPTLSIMLNELANGFNQIGVTQPTPDPPTTRAASVTLRQIRWYTADSIVPITEWANTLYMKFDFIAENAKSEVLGVYVRGDK